MAVGIVVLFHADLAFNGGFIGVDVFFVISGYLITNLILRDLQNGSFSLTQFWERRIRRILPALNFMVLAVLISGWFLLLPPAYEELAKSAIWQALLAANLFFWRNTGYFAGAADEKPLLHTWSLAVEEQFYLIVPFLLFLCWSLRNHRRWLVPILLSGLTFFGLLLSAYGVVNHRSAAFYLLPFRAWELALGAAVACFPLSWLRIDRLMAEAMGWGGFIALLWAATFFDKTTPFPGFWALLPCAGTAVVIWTTQSQDTLLRRVLSFKPIVFIGLISYSLYLWHWPVLSYARYWALGPITVPEKLFLVVGSFSVAVLSYYFVEQPFRQKKLLPLRRSLFFGAAATTSLLLIFGSLIVSFRGVPLRVDPATAGYAAAVEEKAFIHEITIEQIQAGDLPILGKPNGKPSVLLWGDSHAMALAPAVDECLKKMALSGQMITHSSTAPLINFTRNTEYGLNKNAIKYGYNVLEHVALKKIPIVILAGHWGAYSKKPNRNEIGNLEEQLLETVKALKKRGGQPWIFLSVPVHKASIPKVLLRTSMFGDSPDLYLDQPDSDWNGLSGSSEQVIRRIYAEGAKIIDPRAAFLNKNGKSYVVEIEGRSLYRDEQHLTPFASIEKITPLLIQNMGPDLSHLQSAK